MHQCLLVVSQLMSPVAPFFSDWMFQNLSSQQNTSIHLTNIAIADEKVIDNSLEERMEIAQKISSMVLSIRKKKT